MSLLFNSSHSLLSLFSFCWAVIFLFPQNDVTAWIPSLPGKPTFQLHPTTMPLFASKSDDEPKTPDEESEEDFLRCMALVRSLQMSYYKPAASKDELSSNANDNISNSNGIDRATSTVNNSNTTTYLEMQSGKIKNLPVFRAPWWEVPGRSNVLNIHDPIYTNMFETILYGENRPFYFGHLYLEDGSRNLKTNNTKFQLESWETTGQNHRSSAVIGCLMKISDYRRMADGRLLLLVHTIERFLVTDVLQSLPYGTVHAQLLPDAEEMDPALDFGFNVVEQDLSTARAWAVQESFAYHDYEYDPDHLLPVANRPNLQVNDITGSDIAKVLPYCPFSKTRQPPKDTLHTRSSSDDSVIDRSITSEEGESSGDEATPSLEYRLLCNGILQTPLTDPEFDQRKQLTSDQLEYELWLAINNFLIKTRTPVSPVLLGLLPVHLNIWPSADAYTEMTPNRRIVPRFNGTTAMTSSSSSKGESTTVLKQTNETSLTATIASQPFMLKQIVKELASLDSVDHDFVQVSPDYPTHRRQRRLSYCAAHLLESTAEVANDLRPNLLAIPTTQQRLRMVLEKFDRWQEAQWGEFL